MPRPEFTAAQRQALLSDNEGTRAAAVADAHARLNVAGFKLVGFHGCGADDAADIVPTNFRCS